MTVNDAHELNRAGRVLRRANAFYLANIVSVVDVARLAEGDAEDDYFVEIPSYRLHDVGLHISRVTCTVLERFDAGISMFPIPIKASRPLLSDTGRTEELRAAI